MKNNFLIAAIAMVTLAIVAKVVSSQEPPNPSGSPTPTSSPGFQNPDPGSTSGGTSGGGGGSKPKGASGAEGGGAVNLGDLVRWCRPQMTMKPDPFTKKPTNFEKYADRLMISGSKSGGGAGGGCRFIVLEW